LKVWIDGGGVVVPHVNDDNGVVRGKVVEEE